MSTRDAQAEYEQLKEAYNEKVREVWKLREELARKKYALTPPAVTDEMRERDRAIIEMRKDHAMTLQEIGNELGVTRERVRQLLSAALKRRSGAAEDQFPGLSIEDLLVR